MTKLKISLLFLLLSMALIACSVTLDSSTPAPAGTATDAPTDLTEATDIPPTDLPPTDAPAVDETPETDDDGEEAPEDTATEVPAEPTLEPPAWASFQLTGKLVFISFTPSNEQAIMRLDLVTGEIETLFVAEENSILNDATVSPDGSQIVFAYAPPPEGGEVQLGFADLFIMPSDGSAEPTVLTERIDPSETYFNISWPLDDFLYFAHFSPEIGDLGEKKFASRVERMSYPEGELEVLAEEASWPRLSHDGTQMAYVTDAGEFVLSNIDGTEPTPIFDVELFSAVDSPLFSVDGEWLYFSAVPPENSQLSFWDWLLGVKVASAHAVPSDWWRIRLDGSGEMEQLTNIFEIGLFGDVIGEDEYIVFITTNGVQIMNPDGTGVFRLIGVPATGTIAWIP